MKYLVTGGNGFIGSHFIKRLAWRAEAQKIKTEVLNIDARIYGDIPSCIDGLDNTEHFGLENIHSDLYDSCSGKGPGGFDYVVHFAAQSHVDYSIEDPMGTFCLNIRESEELLEWCRRQVNELSKIIHVSTDEVYGPQEYGAVTEHSPYSPRTPYAASKAASDHIALSYYHAYKLPVIVTHCTNNYGTWQYPEKFIPKMIWNVLSGKPITIHGKGEHVRDWIHVDDHIDFLNNVIDRGIAGDTYNCSGAHERTTLQIAGIIKDVLEGEGLPVDMEFIEDRPANDMRYTMRSNYRLGIDAQFDAKAPEVLLPEVIRWYLTNGGIDFMRSFWRERE